MSNLLKFNETLKKEVTFEPFLRLLAMKQENDRDVAMLSALVTISATLPNYIGKLNGKYFSPHLYLFITGRSGSGKAMTTDLLKPVLWELDTKLEDIYKQELAEYTDMLANAKKGDRANLKPPKRRKLILAPDTTSAALFKDLLACEEHGALLATAEADAIADSMNSEFGKSLSQMIRCGFAHTFSELRVHAGKC